MTSSNPSVGGPPLIDDIEVYVYAVDEALRITYINDAWNRFAVANHGESATRERVLGKPLLDFIAEPEHSEHARWIEDLLSGKSEYHGHVFPCHGSDQPPRFFRLHAKRASAPASGLVFWVYDVTRTEEQLRNAEARFQALLSAMTDVVLVFDSQGKYLEIGPTHSELLFRPAEELIGRKIHDVFPPDQADMFVRQIRQAIERRKAVNVDYSIRIGDRQVYFTAAVSPLANDRVVWVARDITDRVLAEQALRQREEQFRSLVQNLSDVIAVIDAEGTIQYKSPSVHRVMGFRPEELIGRSSFERIHPDDLPKLRQTHQELIRNPGRSVTVELQFRHANGTWRHLEATGVSMLDNPAVAGLVITYHDITERKQAESALRENEERFRSMIQNSSDTILILDADGNFTYASPSVERVFGHSPEEVLGKNYLDFTHPDDAARARHVFAEVIRNPGANLSIELRIRRRNGDWRFVDAVGSSMLDNPAIRGVVVNARDVTERKQVDELISRASRLESVGILAGQVAHDFNNQLTAILANASLIRLSTPQPETLVHRVSEIEKASQRARELTGKLLTFSRGGAPIRKPTRLVRRLVEWTDEVVAGTEIRPEYDIAENLLPADVDEVQIAQAFKNVVENAREAIVEKGTVRVRAGNATVGAEIALPIKTGTYVHVSVSDQGPGIPPDDLHRIFDPYFTTRTRGRGLGLATTYSIVQRHGGYITVDSRPDVGTTFSIYLPASEEAQAPVEEAPAPTPALARARILVMDDEAIMRDTLQDVLGVLGHRVAAVPDGTAAIRAYREAMQAGEPFELVILDLTVPGGLGGKETIGQLLDLDPDVRAIVSSGYSDDPIMAEYRQHGFRGVVAKPYTIDELSRVISQALGG